MRVEHGVRACLSPCLFGSSPNPFDLPVGGEGEGAISEAVLPGIIAIFEGMKLIADHHPHRMTAPEEVLQILHSESGIIAVGG